MEQSTTAKKAAPRDAASKVARSFPVDPDGDVHRLTRYHTGLAHPLVAGVQDQVGI